MRLSAVKELEEIASEDVLVEGCPWREQSLQFLHEACMCAYRDENLMFDVAMAAFYRSEALRFDFRNQSGIECWHDKYERLIRGRIVKILSINAGILPHLAQ